MVDVLNVTLIPSNDLEETSKVQIDVRAPIYWILDCGFFDISCKNFLEYLSNPVTEQELSFTAFPNKLNFVQDLLTIFQQLEAEIYIYSDNMSDDKCEDYLRKLLQIMPMGTLITTSATLHLDDISIMIKYFMENKNTFTLSTEWDEFIMALINNEIIKEVLDDGK